MLPTGKNKDALLALVYQLSEEIRGKPLDGALQEWLNRHYGPGTQRYESLARLIRLGVDEQWCAYVEIDGPDYRRGRIAEPVYETADMSVESGLLKDVKGQYHCHTKGEINMIVPLEPGSNFCGSSAGWRVFAPMSEHYPTVQGRALMMFFLPGGKIEYKDAP
ncbi:DUF4863 domain-containing protein [Pandoraea cepalis]|uniref:DUF4863 domain-containing protein n=1 Tax=Pandoraea cepalis TaxID=2508294 RepID=A0AAW7MN53_9BURK|nr:DUF4863 family protein [Pandoraea cepalis]MDN4574114.1 DUF4863 domain-containing protein [Pandoraea cepalis]MDN4579617.1 DUF4863 domain-containing protein [Pandoraea cepalis]